MKVTIKHKGETVVADADTWQNAADDMVKRLGAWVPGESSITKENSEFGATVTDDGAKTRIESQHKVLADAGVTVDTGRQLYATGTRMADVGYANQQQRAEEHRAQQPVADVVATLSNIVKAERRKDVDVDVSEFASKLTVNGAVMFDGHKVREHAIRGLLARIKSPALGYVLGLRDRIVDKEQSENHRDADRAALVDVLQRECKRFAGTPIKMRMREGLKDVFAIVSPSYGVADAPEVLADVLAALPEEAKGSFAYDPITTAWELRADVFTPTPVQEQAVGEPFRAFMSFKSKDGGNGRLSAGGGFDLLACLNAMVYSALSAELNRVHRGRIMVDLQMMVSKSTESFNALLKAWGLARQDVIARPADDSGHLIPLEEAIPGFYRFMLTARRGELVGVLPGRTEKHVKALSEAFVDQRRDSSKIVRADLAQGFTKYIQSTPAPVRRNAESAIARWTVTREAVQFAAE